MHKVFLEQARLLLTQRRCRLSRTSHNMKEHETRGSSHGKKRDDKVQQEGQGATQSKGEWQLSLACGASSTGAGSSGCRPPCSIGQAGKIPPGGDGQQPGGPTGCTLETRGTLVMGKSPDRQKEGEKQTFNLGV